MEGSNLRPARQFGHTPKHNKGTNGKLAPLKDVKNEGRSDYVYENKRPHDKMPDEISGFFRQNEADFTESCAFRRTSDLESLR
jgi:hypothetical protein